MPLILLLRCYATITRRYHHMLPLDARFSDAITPIIIAMICCRYAFFAA